VRRGSAVFFVFLGPAAVCTLPSDPVACALPHGTAVRALPF